jgi:hypothetical protein
MPSYLYNTSSNKLEAFSDDTNFYLKDKTRSIVSHLSMLERQRRAGLQENVDVLSVDLSQTIYPREENTFLDGTVKRNSFSFPWRDEALSRYGKVSSSQIDSRTKTFEENYPNGYALFSYWPLDCYSSSIDNLDPSTSPIPQGELMYKSSYAAYNVSVLNILHARFGRFLTSRTTPNNSVQLQAGKGPFPDSYDKFVQDIKLIYKDYSVLPEYNISEKTRVAFISGTSVYSDEFNTLSLRGTSSYSSNNLFLEQHVHSDHIDSKEYVENNFSTFNLKNIKISVNGVKKLLPYDGFYPQQRSLQLSTLFSQSFAPSTLLQGTRGTFRTATNHLFSRGLYNSIRAGVACDIPMYSSGARTITGITYDRVPFQALIEPNSYLNRGYKIYEYEPIEDSSPLTTTINSTASLGQSDGVYEIAMNNFVAEISNFFLQNSKLSSIKSAPNDQWKFDFGKYSTFTMNVVLSKDNNFTNHDAASYYGYPYNYYVAPYFCFSGSGGQDYWDSGVYYDESIPPSASWKDNRAIATITFDAVAWANSLTNVSTITTPTFEDIKTYSTVTYTNKNIEYFHPEVIVSGTFMPLSSSVELFDSPKNKNNWNIHTKWECPVHNFVGVATYNSGNLDGGTGNSAGDIHRGVWHQYSTNTVSGLNLSLEYSSSVAGTRTQGSLIDACGFDIEPKRVGNLADRKSISEYVVVIPYTVDECQIEKYFKIPLDKFENEYAVADQTEKDNSIRDLIRKSRKCILPPKLNFVHFRDGMNKRMFDEGQYSSTLPPFAMYIFEFSSTLTKQDLSNIWQGVSPSLTDVSEFQKIEINHPISDMEVLNPQNLSAFNGKLPNNVRFKIFKAKAKALTSYKQLVQKTIEDEEQPSRVLSYNWPYDYFSLVEMAKVDVELSLEDGK